MHRIPTPLIVMLTGGRHLTVCHRTGTVLLTAYHCECAAGRSTSGEIVPSGHYDMVFRWGDTVWPGAGTVLYAVDHGERYAEHSALGEIVPSGHYDMGFRWVDAVWPGAGTVLYAVDHRERYAGRRAPPRPPVSC